MDPKRVKYSPATFLNLERQYLSSIISGNYSESVSVTYRGRQLDLWGEFQEAFPAPASVQMRVDESRILRKNAAMSSQAPYVCGCEYCMAKFESDVPYFHSIMDEMLLQNTPERKEGDKYVHQSSPVFAFNAMGNVLSIVHVYEDYAMLHDVTTEMPETPMFSIVKVRPGCAGAEEEDEKRLAKSLYLRRMTPTRLVFAKRLDL